MMSHQQPYCDANTDAALRTFIEEVAWVIDRTIHDATSDAILRTSDQPSLMPSSKPPSKPFDNTKLEAKQQATFKTIFNAIPGLIYLQNSPA